MNLPLLGLMFLTLQNKLIKYEEKCLADVSPFCYLVFNKTKLGKIMIGIECLINSLNKATVLEVKRDKNSFITVSIRIPTDDLDDIYNVCSNGCGFILHWEGMEMITEDITFSKEDFKLLHKEVLKELMERAGE